MSKLIEATELLLHNQNYSNLYKIYLDLIHNKIVEIGVKLNIRPPKSNEKVYDYMVVIDEFLLKNINIELFKDHIQKVASFHNLYDNVNNSPDNLKLEKFDVKELIEEYYDLKRIKVPNVFQEIDRYNIDKYANYQTLNAYNLVFGKNDKNYNKINIEDTLHELISNRIRNDQLKIKRDYEKRKLTFDRSFRKLTTLHSIQKAIDASGKKSSQIEVSGSLTDNLDYKIYTLQMIGYFILSFGIISAILLFFTLVEIFLVPTLTMSLYPCVLFSGLICLISFYISIKYLIRG